MPPKTKTKKTEAKAVSHETPPAAVDGFNLSAGQVVEIPAGTAAPQGPALIANGGGSSLFYASKPEVIEDPTELAVGESVTVKETVYLTASSGTRVVVTRHTKPRAVDPRRAA